MEIFGIGLPEVLVIAVVALIVLGPDRLPEAARTLGKAVADLRRAMEPARSAWADVTRELTEVTASATQITGNPWTVHPLAEGMSPEERDRFFKTGELPRWKQLEMDTKEAAHRNGSNVATIGDAPDIDYPMPHAEAHSTEPAPALVEPVEELSYPEPGQFTEEEKT